MVSVYLLSCPPRKRESLTELHLCPPQTLIKCFIAVGGHRLLFPISNTWWSRIDLVAMLYIRFCPRGSDALGRRKVWSTETNTHLACSLRSQYTTTSTLCCSSRNRIRIKTRSFQSPFMPPDHHSYQRYEDFTNPINLSAASHGECNGWNRLTRAESYRKSLISACLRRMTFSERTRRSAIRLPPADRTMTDLSKQCRF